jgi:regulatory protein
VITTASLNKKTSLNPPEGRKPSPPLEGLGEAIRKYCAYQERCPNDVRQKFYEWKIEKQKAEQLLKELISEDYINEERFAKAFVRGKFRIKSWGIAKITNELRRKGISENCIAQALQEIDAEAYKETLEKLTQQWLAKHKTETEFVRKQKLFRYLLSKGYKINE